METGPGICPVRLGPKTPGADVAAGLKEDSVILELPKSILLAGVFKTDGGKVGDPVMPGVTGIGVKPEPIGGAGPAIGAI